MDIKLFFNNQQSIKLSYDIAESFRKQNFYIATSKLKKLLGNLDTVAGYIFSQEDSKALADELQLILLALLDAQDNCDYVTGGYYRRRFAAFIAEASDCFSGT